MKLVEGRLPATEKRGQLRLKAQPTRSLSVGRCQHLRWENAAGGVRGCYLWIGVGWDAQARQGHDGDWGLSYRQLDRCWGRPSAAAA